jgi:membrane protease YdiL (CAAX protease family)
VSDRRYPTDALGLPEGLLAAIMGALLLVGAFAFASSDIPMSAAARWGSLTTFTLLALGATLPGCAALYDGLGRVLRRDLRALTALLAVLPALYIAYAQTVRALDLSGALAAIAFTLVPAAALVSARASRQPTPLDAVGLGYLAASLWLGLLPGLTLPENRGLVGFFDLASVPLLLLLFAARGWPGVGYSWHMSLGELRAALLAGAAALIVVLAADLAMGALGIAAPPPTAGGLLIGAVSAYFFVALPAELLLRGGIQNGLARALAGGALGEQGRWLALITAATAWAGLGMLRGGWSGALAGAAVGLAGGWVYLRTGKVTAAAVSHFLVVWTIESFF